MKKTVKTNAMRLLDRAGVPYEVFIYEYDDTDLSAYKAAAAVGADVSLLYKTLVVRGEPNGVFVCLVAGNQEIDLKKAAAASGNKKAAMVAMKELLPLTGYVRGGCTPVGMKKPYRVFIDESCLVKDYIYISAGARGVQLKIKPGDLISFIGAVTVGLT